LDLEAVASDSHEIDDEADASDGALYPYF
jgi:hypothetical protein